MLANHFRLKCILKSVEYMTMMLKDQVVHPNNWKLEWSGMKIRVFAQQMEVVGVRGE